VKRASRLSGLSNEVGSNEDPFVERGGGRDVEIPIMETFFDRSRARVSSTGFPLVVNFELRAGDQTSRR